MGQIRQDDYILTILKNKHHGFFIEIGSNDPVNINNTYKLESKYAWKGIMIEYDGKWLPSYKQLRPNSIHVIQDATTINYAELFANNNVPTNVDYLQIDLDVNHGNSTLRTLQKLDTEIFDTYKFATITFEHDIYAESSASPSTREVSRQIFERRGYYRVLSDISYCNNPFEDWYVHPDLVDMGIVQEFQAKNSALYVPHSLTTTTLRSEDMLF